MLSPKIKRDILRVIPVGMFWLIFSIVYTVLERGILGNLNYYPSTGNPYNFASNIFFTPVSALVTGLIIGTLEIRYFNKLFREKSFSKKILYKSIIYLAIIVTFLLIISAIANATELRTGVFSKQVWDNVWAFVSDYAFLSVVFYMASIITVSQFYSEISENIGQGVLANFFTGKYHTPTEEERIYMFLDMKSSTAIAESLGHVRYFEMLKEYYADLSAPIIQHSGEIYQYVGDEMVVTWTLNKGLHANNCVQCFYSMKDAISKQSGKYMQKFGLVPSFKAGFHFGKVTTGEIGVIKKDIIFTGDVLNTTARIQGLCNFYEVDILVSGDLTRKLDLPAQYQIRSLGENELKGRAEKIELFTIITHS
jgi:class 3 adenylate cyclase